MFGANVLVLQNPPPYAAAIRGRLLVGAYAAGFEKSFLKMPIDCAERC